jgi:hypothetical protein
LRVDLNVDVGQGTCTMKYSPKVNDQLARSSKVADLHPLQDEATVQGILEILYRFEQILKEISGMDRFSLQPGAPPFALTCLSALRFLRLQTCSHTLPLPASDSPLSRAGDGSALWPGPRGFTLFACPAGPLSGEVCLLCSSRELLKSQVCLRLTSDPSSRRRPCPWKRLVRSTSVRDFHPQVSAHAGRTKSVRGLRRPRTTPPQGMNRAQPTGTLPFSPGASSCRSWRDRRCTPHRSCP